MYTKRSRITNILIIVILLVVAILLIVSGYFHYNVKKRMYEDSYLINQLGLIRGNIQRYAKFKIANIQNDKIFDEIENTINSVKFLINKEKKFSENFYEICNKQLKDVENDLLILQITNGKKEILSISEKLWQKTNNLVEIALKYHKYKFATIINVFDYLIYSTVVFLILILFFLYHKVKKGLEVETITDKLTGLYNRLYFNEIYNYLIEKYHRDKKPFSLLIIDIDNFKKINDTYGHQTGDEVLKKIGAILKHSIRKTDFAFRYGGEEFVIIYPETPLEEAYRVSERILFTIPIKVKVDLNPVTISGGIGEYKGENPKDFFEKVDDALYLAKKLGKNRIVKI